MVAGLKPTPEWCSGHDTISHSSSNETRQEILLNMTQFHCLGSSQNINLKKVENS